MYRNLSWRPGVKIIPDRGITYTKLEEHSNVVSLEKLQQALKKAKWKENGLWSQFNLGSNPNSVTHQPHDLEQVLSFYQSILSFQKYSHGLTNMAQVNVSGTMFDTDCMCQKKKKMWFLLQKTKEVHIGQYVTGRVKKGSYQIKIRSLFSVSVLPITFILLCIIYGECWIC